MKTFNELILWELEHEAQQKTTSLSLTEEQESSSLGASVLRKLRHLKADGETKSFPGGLNPA